MLEPAGWLGIGALGVIIISGIIWFRAALAVRIPADRSVFVAAWALGVAMAVAALLNQPGWLGGTGAVMAMLAGLFFLFTVLISRQVLAREAVSVGQVMPEFSAPDDSGNLFHSGELAGKPALIKFFRGHW